MSEPLTHTLYRQMVSAESAWMALVHLLPGRAGDNRYLPISKGEPGSAIRAAHDLFISACDAWWKAAEATWSQPQS